MTFYFFLGRRRAKSSAISFIVQKRTRSPNSQGFVSPDVIEKMWRDHDWVYREHGYAVFPMTIHPDVSGARMF
jgi:hypothetical protein